jgi:hypothetical protein
MSGESSKDNNPGRGVESSMEHDPQLPTYQESNPDPFMIPESLIGGQGPTVSSPFNFPKSDLPPGYTSPLNKRPIAIPQVYNDQAAPFLDAYPPSLLAYGIPAPTWYSFVDTISAFLTAQVGKRAISHAGDIAASVGKVPVNFGKDTVKHAKSVAQNIGVNAKSGNLGGVIGGVIGGTVGLTVGTAGRLVGSVLSLPGTAISASKSLKSPRDRAQAYGMAANKEWLQPRGLQVSFLSTTELSELLGVSVGQILDLVNSKTGTPAEQLGALKEVLDYLEIKGQKGQLGSQIRQPSQTSSRKLSPAGYSAGTKQMVEVEEEVVASSSNEASGSNEIGSLHLSAQTLWIVVTHT